MSKIIFGCMNIGNKYDTTINLIHSINNSGLIICESIKKFNKFLNDLSIKPSANIVQWDYDIIDHNIPDSLKNYNKDILDLINTNINNNKDILIVSDEGSSLLLDPADYFLEYCIKNNIKYQILPGPSAVIQSFLHNKIFTSAYAEFHFYGWFSNLSIDKKEKILNDLLKSEYTSVMFLWHQTASKDIKMMVDNNIDKTCSLCLNLTFNNEMVFSGKIVDIYNKIVNKDIIIDETTLISLVIN